MALTKIDDRGLKTPIDLLDNEKIRFGTGNDLELYHNGSSSYLLHNGDGNLVLVAEGSGEDVYIKANDDIYLQPSTNQDGLKVIGGGAVELYYDGSKKFETNSLGATITRDLTLNHASGDTALRWAVGGTNKFSLYESSGTLRFYDNTNNAERLRITSDGKVRVPDNGIFVAGTGEDLKIYHDGTHNYLNFVNGALIFRDNTTNRAYFHATDGHFLPWANNTYDIGSVGNAWRNLVSIKASINTSASTGTAFTGGDDLVIGDSTNGTRSGITLVSASNTDGGVYFSDDASATSGQLVYQHSSDHFKIYTGGVSTARFDSDGLKFGTDSAAANGLDDYEEGTWSPTLPNGSTSALQIHSAFYTKIGRQVMCYMYVYSINISGSTNEFRFAGLPFTVKSGQHYGGGSIGYVGTLDYQKPLLPLVSTGNSHLYFHRQDGSSAPWTYQDQVNVGGGTNGFLILNVHYLTDA